MQEDKAIFQQLSTLLSYNQFQLLVDDPMVVQSTVNYIEVPPSSTNSVNIEEFVVYDLQKSLSLCHSVVLGIR